MRTLRGKREESLQVERILLVEFSRYLRRRRRILKSEDIAVLKDLFDISAIQQFVDEDTNGGYYAERIAKRRQHKRMLSFLARRFAHEICIRGINNIYENSEQLAQVHIRMKSQGCDIYPCCINNDEETHNE